MTTQSNHELEKNKKVFGYWVKSRLATKSERENGDVCNFKGKRKLIEMMHFSI